MHIIASIISLLTASALAQKASNHTKSIEAVALSVSDPASQRFRQYLTAEEAVELAKQLPYISFPTDTSTRKVQKEHLLRRYDSSTHIKQVDELDKRDNCAADDLVTPTCIRQVYNIDYTPQPSRVTFGVYATEASTFSPTDLATFLEQYRPEASNATYDIVGFGDPTNADSFQAPFETALDTQTLLGTAWPAKAILYDLGGVFGPNPGQPYQPFVDFLHGLISNDSIPSVVSFSESLPEDMMDESYARTLCQTMALVGARGVSLLFSSGDNGPNGDSSGGSHKAIFESEFPASCPWVTAVGGTTNLANETGATSATIPAFDQTFYAASGGGFSALFNAPAYQRADVAAYIHNYVPRSYYSESSFNPGGRGIPDVSAFSVNVPTVVNGISVPLGGTSASTPLWAAIIVLLNDYEASKGRPPLGFLNPWLYSLQADQEATKDITTGGNSKGGCNALSGCTLIETLGYDVSPGWDPVSGLGSPQLKQLMQALDSLATDC